MKVLKVLVSQSNAISITVLIFKINLVISRKRYQEELKQPILHILVFKIKAVSISRLICGAGREVARHFEAKVDKQMLCTAKL